jgi:glycosyltransferase involved in cell wall biosynthesis
MKISAALIVKNEENILAGCLESIKDAVDEIIIVDTGSEDRTKEIARQFTDRLYDYPWQKDFAAARQYSFDLATGDWVLWLDADDLVLNADKIRPSLLQARFDIKGFYWKYIVGQDEYGNSTCELWRERCVRNDHTFRWTGRVHEVLLPSCSPRLVRNEEVVVMHRRGSHRQNRNPYRNIEILKEEYERKKANPEPRLLLYLGNEHADLGQPDLALEYLQRYVRVSNWDEEKYLTQVKIAALIRAQHKYEEALDADLQALKTCPHWPQAYFSLGETYYFLKDWEKVTHWMELGLQLPVPDTVCVVSPIYYKYQWIIYYTNALYHTRRWQEALEWTQRALKICPNEAWHISNLRTFEEALQSLHV